MNRLKLAEPGNLADAGFLSNRTMMLSEFDREEYYVSVPTDSGEIIKIREDFFDQYPDHEFSAIMDYLEPYQEKTMSGLFSGMRERMATRREERKENKAQKQEVRAERREQRGETLKNIVGQVAGIFKKPEETPQYRELDITGGIGVDYNQPSAGMSQGMKTALIIGGVALGGFLLYKLAKRK
jgi:hypothetical protein